jgi:hypothetical protein
MNPIDRIVNFMEGMEAARHPKDPLTILDRERYWVTVILSILSDPKHPVGQPIMSDLIKTYKERGGTFPFQGLLGRHLLNTDQFDFAAQWLYDSGMRVRDIANVLGSHEQTIYKVIRFYRDKENEDDESD